MKRRKTAGFAVVFALLIGAAVPGFAAEQFSKITVVVVREASGKPVRNASVIFHQLDKDGKQKKNSTIQLKTNDEGKAEYPTLEYGPTRVQVIAPGLRTFGEDIVIDKPEQLISVKLQKPKDQYSIYENKR
jgi:hypothetical protein